MKWTIELPSGSRFTGTTPSSFIKRWSFLKEIERRKTVAAKPAVQQRKGKSLLCGYTGGCILRYKGKCTKSPGEVICGHRKPSPVA